MPSVPGKVDNAILQRHHPPTLVFLVLVLELVLVDVGRRVHCELLLPHSRSR